jgi:hypothetical protein
VALALIGASVVAVAATMVLGFFDGSNNRALLPGLAVGAVLAIMGLGLVVLGLMGRRVAGFVAATLAIALTAGPAVAVVHAFQVTGDRTSIGSARYRPQTAGAADKPFTVTMGNLVVDLRDLPVSKDRPLTIDIGVGMGRAKVILPADVPVLVEGSVEAGGFIARSFDDDWLIGSSGLQQQGTGLQWWSAYGETERWSEFRGSAAVSAAHGDYREAEGVGVSLTGKSPEVADGEAPWLTVTAKGQFVWLVLIEADKES